MKLAGKLYYKIGEVSRMTSLPAHVLRYWETEFPFLKPTKNRAGQRVYRREDIRLIQAIKELLYDEGYTIAGARQKISQLLEDKRPAPDGKILDAEMVVGRRDMENIRQSLEQILAILNDWKL